MSRASVALGASFLLAVGISAHATMIIPPNTHSVEWVSGGAVITSGNGIEFQGRNFADPAPTRGVKVNSTGSIPLGGNQLAITASRTVPPAAAARAGAALLKGLPVLGAGIALWDVWNAIRVSPDGSGDGLLVDPGVDPITTTGVLWECGSAPRVHSSLSSACATQVPATSVQSYGTHTMTYTHQLGACRVTLNGPSVWVGNCDLISNTSCVSHSSFVCSTYTPTTVVGWKDGYGGEGQVTECPASIDPLDPANSIPSGGAPGPDGKCPQARYHHDPISIPDAADRLEDLDPQDFPTYRDWVRDALDDGISVDAGPYDIQGPASLPGVPKVSTKTNPDGSTVTTTDTPTVNYNYDGDTITYNITNITTIVTRNAEGDITSTETIEDEDVPEESDQCKLHPDSLACVKLGEPGTEAPVWQTETIPFGSEDVGGAIACPAPNTWTVFGMSLTWGYQPVCDVAPMIRVALLLLASFGAIGIVFRETQS